MGAGRIGKMHAKFIATHPKAKLKYIYDINSEFAEEVAKSTNCSIVSSPEDAINADDIDAVLIAIRTASISSALIASSGEDTIEQFVDFATSSANSELISYMYFNFAFGCVAINLACIFPIRPAPIKEKLIIIK